MTLLRDLIVAEIEAAGPMPFERFVELALYHPVHGFYVGGGRAGRRRGDFVTSVEVGPLFAAILGDWLDAMWRAMGEPDDFRVAEAAAGVGTLFRGIHRSRPACFEALTWTLVEVSTALRGSHSALPGDRWRSASELPGEHQHVILANELLDNLPFGIAHRSARGWVREHVVFDGQRLAVEPSDLEVDFEIDAPIGTKLPIAEAALGWIARARASAGTVLVFDYAATNAELIDRSPNGWLRAYRSHQRVVDLLTNVGTFDITHDVPIDQLPPPTSIAGQADWLRANGLEARVEDARERWRARAHVGDLAAIAARSAVLEGEALTDPTGLGAFSALEWRVLPAGGI